MRQTPGRTLKLPTKLNRLGCPFVPISHIRDLSPTRHTSLIPKAEQQTFASSRILAVVAKSCAHGHAYTAQLPEVSTVQNIKSLMEMGCFAYA